MPRPRKNSPKVKKEKSSSTSTARAVERAYEYLHHQAVSFGIRPGERINEVEVAANLEMSRAPVREALNRLVMNGLVAFEPGKGFFCRKLSVKEVSELFELRSDMEASAVHSAVKTAKDEDIQAVREFWSDVVAQGNKMDIEALLNYDEEFHLKVIGLAGNSERVKFMQNINERIRFVRRINLESEGRRATIIGEHSQLLDAIAQRDENTALKLLESHLKFSHDDLRAYIHEGIARIYADETA